jgi:hypothetical protein
MADLFWLIQTSGEIERPLVSCDGYALRPTHAPPAGIRLAHHHDDPVDAGSTIHA